MAINVYSKLQDDQRYEVQYRTFVIVGMANGDVENPWTPQGRLTKVSDEDFYYLRQNIVFQLQWKNGALVVEADKLSTLKPEPALPVPDTEPEPEKVKQPRRTAKKGK